MNDFGPKANAWLASVVGPKFTADKHAHSHQDEVYRIQTPLARYYLKVAAALEAERDNLKKLQKFLQVPRVIDFHIAGGKEYLLLSELPGKNLVELLAEWSNLDIVNKFAEAVRQLHAVDATRIFPQAKPTDVLLHGDMALPNILISDPDQREKTAIGYIDFGQLTFGPPDADLADALWSLQRNISPDYGELFLKQYGPVLMTPTIEKALKFRYQGPSKD